MQWAAAAVGGTFLPTHHVIVANHLLKISLCYDVYADSAGVDSPSSPLLPMRSSSLVGTIAPAINRPSDAAEAAIAAAEGGDGRNLAHPFSPGRGCSGGAEGASPSGG